MRWNNSRLPQGWIAHDIGKEHHLAWSDKCQLERFAIHIASDHDEIVEPTDLKTVLDKRTEMLSPRYSTLEY